MTRAYLLALCAVLAAVATTYIAINALALLLVGVLRVLFGGGT